MSKNILVLAAHPDDEVLGCGGTIARFVSEGSFIHVAFLADGVSSRQGSARERENELQRRRSAARSALAILGVSSISFEDYPDNRMDTIAVIDIARNIEKLLEKYAPEIVLTHHFGDVNVDHVAVHKATVVACRPQPKCRVKKILLYEVASSTEWQIASVGKDFHPNYFCDISGFLDLKLASLNAYDEEMREWPHSRSVRAQEILAQWRGSTVGVCSAEAFMVGRIIE